MNKWSGCYIKISCNDWLQLGDFPYQKKKDLDIFSWNCSLATLEYFWGQQPRQTSIISICFILFMRNPLKL